MRHYVKREAAEAALKRAGIPWHDDAKQGKKRAWCDAGMSVIVCWKFSKPCPRCGKPAGQVHHIIGKGMGGANFAYRYHPCNCIALDLGCHIMNPDSAERDGSAFLTWLKESIPWQWEWVHQADRNFTIQHKDYDAVWLWLVAASKLETYEEFIGMPPWYEWKIPMTQGATG